MARLAALALFAAVSIAPEVASACSDAGSGNFACSDGGPVWISCTYHDDCPSGQVCGSLGMCTCPSECIEEVCNAEGCHCCYRVDSGCSHRFACEPALDDAGMDGGTVPAPSAGCSVGSRAFLVRPPMIALAMLAIVRSRRSRRRPALRTVVR